MGQKRIIFYADGNAVEDFKAKVGIKVQEVLEGQKDDADSAIRAADEAIGTLNTLGDTLENLKSSVGDAVNIDDVTLDITSKLVSMMVVEETPPHPSQSDVAFRNQMNTVDLLKHITRLKDDISDIEIDIRKLNRIEGGTASD